jgi:hypothetical protein
MIIYQTPSKLFLAATLFPVLVDSALLIEVIVTDKNV